MKAISILAAAAVLLLGTAGVFGQSLTIDHVDGLNGSGALDTDVPISIYIGMTAGPDNIWGMTSGFRVYSDNGAQWNTTSGAWVDVTSSVFEQMFVQNLSITGSGADTIGFSGFRMFTNGIPGGFEGIAFRIDMGPIDAAYNGTTICLDSAYYPPSGLFKWVSSVGDVLPEWGGPYCWSVGETVPMITCPGDDEIRLCGPFTMVYEFSYSNTDQVSASEPAYIEGNYVYVPIEEPGTQTITLTAGTPPTTAECSFNVITTFDEPPTVTVDPAFEFNACPGDTLSFTFTANDPEGLLNNLSSSFGTITEEGSYYVLTFSFGTGGVYDFYITATDACGNRTTATTQVTINLNPVAEITCPDNLEYTACEAGTLEISVPINPADAIVTVNHGTYDPLTGILSYPFTSPEVVTFNITAEAECGIEECSFVATIDIIDPPEIYCPDDQIITFCEPGTVCLGVPILNADEIVTNVGTYIYGQICFNVAAEGDYPIELTATNTCGSVNCQFVVTAIQECPEQTTTVEPDSIPVYWAFTVVDRFVHVYLGNLVGENTVEDVNLSTLTVNGVSGTASVIPSHHNYVGSVVEITMPIYNFIENYMPLFNLASYDYVVTGAFNDGSPINETGTVKLRGLLVGDLNLDNSVDISDLVLMVEYFFQQGEPPRFLESADLDHNNQVDITDLIKLVQMLFNTEVK
ncbi:MAG TPA: dockerin type I repeat-containing protein [candidate division Zixibacteria bacterium]|nr:dockerin type I repeat-containing protein [candidate division Zixibacteria bacterium]